MRDVELYRQVLGLEAPWTVTRVELSVTEERVDVGAAELRRGAVRLRHEVERVVTRFADNVLRQLT